jgi:hypothetical protein
MVVQFSVGGGTQVDRLIGRSEVLEQSVRPQCRASDQRSGNARATLLQQSRQFTLGWRLTLNDGRNERSVMTRVMNSKPFLATHILTPSYEKQACVKTPDAISKV